MRHSNIQHILSIMAMFDDLQDMKFALKLHGYDAFKHENRLSAGSADVTYWEVRLDGDYIYLHDNDNPDKFTTRTWSAVKQKLRRGRDDYGTAVLGRG